MNRAKRWMIACAGLALIPIPAAVAQAAPPAEETPALDSPDNPWRVELTAWAWLLGMEGQVGARGIKADVSASFVDIMDHSDSIIALAGRAEVGYGKLGFYVDPLYADVGADNQSGPLGFANVDLDIEQTIVDFGLMYRIVDREPTGDAAGSRQHFTVDLYGGGRYADLDVTLRPEVLATRTQNQSWVDPVVGAKLVAPLSDRWHMSLNGDVGGFGVASDFTWSATAVFGYDFHLFKAPASVYAGYRAIGWDYTNGSGTDEFTWDMIEHGILVGLALRF